MVQIAPYHATSSLGGRHTHIFVDKSNFKKPGVSCAGHGVWFVMPLVNSLDGNAHPHMHTKSLDRNFNEFLWCVPGLTSDIPILYQWGKHTWLLHYCTSSTVSGVLLIGHLKADIHFKINNHHYLILHNYS